MRMSWHLILKGRGGAPRSQSIKMVEATVKSLIEQFVEGKDEFTSDEIKAYLIDNLKSEHIKRNSVDGKVTTIISGAPTRYIQNRLDGAMKTKIPIWIKKHGYQNYNTSRMTQSDIDSKPFTTFKKSDSWESMVDSMIADGKLFDEIYTAILRKYKFSSPSKEEVLNYLNSNYERHPLFSNKWSTKSEGE